MRPRPIALAFAALGLLLTSGPWAAPPALAQAAVAPPDQASHAMSWTRDVYAYNSASGAAQFHRVLVSVDPSLEMSDSRDTYAASVQPPPGATVRPASVTGVARGTATSFQIDVPKRHTVGGWEPHNWLEAYSGAIRVTVTETVTDPENPVTRTFLLPYAVEIGQNAYRGGR